MQCLKITQKLKMQQHILKLNQKIKISNPFKLKQKDRDGKYNS